VSFTGSCGRSTGSRFDNMHPAANKKIIATIEARMTSSRLPGKVLLPLAGRPALERMIERVRRSRYLDGISVATTTNSADDMIVDLAKRMKVSCFRGSECDVLGRVVQAARAVAADIVVELTADCPAMDARVIDRGIEEYFAHPCDCSTNVIKRTYARGFDVQVYPLTLLTSVDAATNDPLDREHVTRYIYLREGAPYHIHHWKIGGVYAWPELRMTLDERDDWILINAVFERLITEHSDFIYEDVIDLLRAEPDMASINSHVKQKIV
jgi:spore coat polysaccharide biosynthesis protein SpsF